MRTTWTFHSAGEIIFGQNAVLALGETCTRLGGTRALIVSDAILEGAGLINRVREPLVKSGLAIEAFTGGEPEPSFHVGDRCLELAKTFRPDVIIGLGGGSNMDLAKLCATVLTHCQPPRFFVGDGKIPGPIMPLVCIPTTAGTGSEVSASAVLTDAEAQMKVGILSNYLRPRVALVDPLLTVSCPPKVSADSGIDALTHAIEAYTAVDNAQFPLPAGETTVYQGKQPMGDMVAERAIRLVGQYLRRAVRDGTDLEAREGMALAALLGGLAFSNVGVALVHAMEYPVGGALHVSHGAGNGLLLPYVMRFNMPGREREYREIAHMLGEDVSGLGTRAAAERAIEAVAQLRDDIGVPGKLSALGMKPAQLRPFAEKACAIKRILRVNPRQASVEEVMEIYKSAM